MHLSKEGWTHVAEGLEAIKKRRLDPVFGICGNLELYFEKIRSGIDGYKVVEHLAKSWPHHSGQEKYPVGGEEAYHDCFGSKWNKRTCKEASSRMDLLDYCIAKAKKNAKLDQ